MSTSQQRVLDQLYEGLWKTYIGRVHYAADYCALVESKGGRVVNDHIALRTFHTHTGEQPSGVAGLSRIFLPLGYKQAGTYRFKDKHLTAWHYEHSNPLLPKVFISQLEVDQLPSADAKLITDAVKNTKDPLTAEAKTLLESVAKKDLSPQEETTLAKALEACFIRPWGVPKRSTVEQVNKASQYAAWTLLHGNSINHFTAYINEQQVESLPDLVSTVEALRKRGVPMKNEIEGEPGSKLVQSSTQAVQESCPVIDDNGKKGHIDWSYAYYELAERNMIMNEHGEKFLFTGFLGDQATNLFEMTKTGK
jgi:hypothetical protein